jgi:hypothetical protein
VRSRGALNGGLFSGRWRSSGVGVLHLDGGVGGGSIFGVVGDVEAFDKHSGEIVDVFAGFLAALFQEKELAEVTEGGGAARGDAVSSQGAENGGEGGVNLVLGGRIAGERFEVDVFVALGRLGLTGFLELAVGAAEAVELADGREAAVAAIGIGKLAKVEVSAGSFRSHGQSIFLFYISV